MKKILTIIISLIFSLPVFSLENVDLDCTFIPAGNNEPFSLESLYFSSDGKVYDSKNAVVGKIISTSANTLTASVFENNILVYLTEQKMSTYTYKMNNSQMTAYGSCKIKQY